MLFVDRLHPKRQELLARIPGFLPYPAARRLLIRRAAGDSDRDEYLASMRLEVLWLGRRYLKRNFTHRGVENIDPERTYVITSLHFGQWGMYPASLFQQRGIASQMIMTGRNMPAGSPESYFWKTFGHRKQILSGHPGSYSTDGFFTHARRLEQGISQISILDVREHGLPQKEVAVNFMGGPYYLPRTVPLLARRAGVDILPYIGYYDVNIRRHRVQWFPPVSPQAGVEETLQRLVDCFEPTFSQHPAYYFNVLEHFRTRMP